jgi:hypothetical protein
MNSLFKFVNTHINHLAELPIINMLFKWDHMNIFPMSQSCNFDNRLAWFLARLIMI